MSATPLSSITTNNWVITGLDSLTNTNNHVNNPGYSFKVSNAVSTNSNYSLVSNNTLQSTSNDINFDFDFSFSKICTAQTSTLNFRTNFWIDPHNTNKPSPTFYNSALVSHTPKLFPSTNASANGITSTATIKIYPDRLNQASASLPLADNAFTLTDTCTIKLLADGGGQTTNVSVLYNNFKPGYTYRVSGQISCNVTN